MANNISYLTAFEICKDRNSKYGNRSLLLCGISGIIVRCIDKLCRLENMIKNNLYDSSESRVDSIIDLFNYSILAVLLLKGELK